jgi:hypothetical protein
MIMGVKRFFPGLSKFVQGLITSLVVYNLFMVKTIFRDSLCSSLKGFIIFILGFEICFRGFKDDCPEGRLKITKVKEMFEIILLLGNQEVICRRKKVDILFV